MKVLVGVDGSTGSDFAVALAGKLLRDDTTVVLYYAPPEVKIRGIDDKDAILISDARSAMAERLFAHARQLLPAAISADAQCVVGTHKARQGILAAANLHRPDMIIVGARGNSRVAAFFLGSVSRTVVHGADVPVLVGRGALDELDRPLKVVLAYDRYGTSSDAIDLVCELKWPAGTTCFVIHVVESLFAGEAPEWLAQEVIERGTEPLSEVWAQYEKKNREQAQIELATLCQRLPEAFRVHPPIVVEGHPGDQIVKFISDQQIDLAIVGTRSLGTIARLFGGSTSEHVLAHATCSVLLVPYHEVP
jgi:nucleotide-binding universal stress UspA family protein